MGAQLRVYRRRMRSVQATKKITRAMELIAASRIVKSQQRVAASKPYTEELTRVVTAVANNTVINHALTTPRPNPRRAAVVLITSDRGLAGAYSSSAIKCAEELNALLRSQGKDVVSYIVGRKGLGYYRFRQRPIEADYTGFSEQPTYADAKRVAGEVISSFVSGSDDVQGNPDGIVGVDEIHLVFTRYVSALTQRPTAVQVLPLQIEVKHEDPPADIKAQYFFEPSSEELLDALLPRYVESRIYAALLEAAASESASRRRAMKSATDNAEELLKTLTRQANSARQAEITQEISEIVGGANALADAMSE